MQDYQYICFDLDGTLVESGEGIKDSLRSVFADYNLDLGQIGDLDKFIGPPLRQSFMKYCGFGKDEVDHVIEDYRSYYFAEGQYKMHLYEGVTELLRDLHSAGRDVILITSKLQQAAENVLDRFGIRQYFRYVAGSMPDNTMTDKTELIGSVIDRMGITDKTRMVMIGDREYDAIGAVGSGITCIGVLYGYGSYNELTEAGATYFAENVGDLRLYLQVDKNIDR
jgi:phosphoglycolate phosphatase